MNKEKSNFLLRKRANSKTVNYLAFISGMVTSLMAILLAWNFLTSPTPLAEATPKSVTVAKTRVKKSTQPILVENLDANLPTATADQLEELLIRINEWDRQAALAVRMSQNSDRVNVADQLLKLPISEQQRILAIESKLSALSALYVMDFLSGLNSPKFGASLREIALLHNNDANAGLALKCNLALFKVEAFEAFRNPKPGNIASIVDLSTALLKSYPENDYVLSTIDLVVKTLPIYDKNYGTKLRREMISRANEFKSPFTEDFVQSLIDHVKLNELGYRDLFENRWIDREAGQQQLFEATLQLATDPEGGELLIDQIKIVLNWLEQNNNYDQCQQVFQAILDSADNREVEATRLAARQLAEHGLARINLLGKKLEFNGKLISGDALDHADLKDKIVIVIFWSEEKPDSFSLIRKFHAEYLDLRRPRVRVLAVCTDDQFDDKLVLQSKQIPDFQIVTNRVGNRVENWLADQYPVDKLPHAMIIDRLGKVVDTNVPLDELITTTELLVMQRDDSPSGDSLSDDSPSEDSANTDQSPNDP
jgi:hypothetical protein